MKITHILAVVLILPACNQPKTATKSTPVSTAPKVGSAPALPNTGKPTPVDPLVPTVAGLSNLVGTWTLCSPSSSDEDFKSSFETVVFTDETNVKIDVKYFSDAKCTSPFTQAQADSILKSIPFEYPEETAQYKTYLDYIVKGAQEVAQYKASAINATGYGEFNVTSKDSDPTFLAYKLTANQLFITEPCEPVYEEGAYPDDEEGYQLKGAAKHKIKIVSPKLIAKQRTQSELALESVPIENPNSSLCGYSTAKRSIDFKNILPYIKK